MKASVAVISMSMSPWSSTKPSCAYLIAGAISAARCIVPYFARAISMPDTVPGTPTASMPSVLAPLHHVAVLVEIHVRGRGQRRLLAEVEESLAAIGQLYRHEAAAAEIARRRVDHSQRIAHRDGRIHRIAAGLQHIHADMRRQVLRRDHHAVLGGHRRLRGGLRVELAESEAAASRNFANGLRFIVRMPC